MLLPQYLFKSSLSLTGFEKFIFVAQTGASYSQ